MEGICGYAQVLNQPKKTSEIPDEEKRKLFDRNLFQLPVHIHTFSRNALIPKKILFHFPSLNTRPKLRPWNESVLYWDNGLNYEIKYLSFRFPYSQIIPPPSENEFRLMVHILREQALHTRFYRQIASKAEKCSICFFPNPQLENFFELHETLEIDFDEPFVPVSSNNFIALCPNCHKLEHKKIAIHK